MKIFSLLALAALAVTALESCGGTSPAPAATSNPPPPAVTGLSMPKSVSVVTAN